MSILDITNKYTKRKITKSFLKKHGFYVDRWGGPHDRERETTTFYEALYSMDIGIFPYSNEDHTVTATIKYFPDEFDGYTTIGKNWGRGNVAGKLVITYENDRSFEFDEPYVWDDTIIFDCKTHADFYNAIDYFNIDLMKKGYECIRY